MGNGGMKRCKAPVSLTSDCAFMVPAMSFLAVASIIFRVAPFSFLRASARSTPAVLHRCGCGYGNSNSNGCGCGYGNSNSNGNGNGNDNGNGYGGE